MTSLPVGSSDSLKQGELRRRDVAVERRSSYAEILESSVLIGAASVITVAIGIVRTKALALILGPAGIGLMALYSSISDLARGVAGLGVSSSGVRQIAEAAGSGDAKQIKVTATVVQRTSLVLAVIGALGLCLVAGEASRLTFGSDAHTSAVALLGLAVAFQLVADGRAAIVQGMRRIGDLAKINVLGALLGSALCILMALLYGERGIVPSLVGMAAIAAVIAWGYGRRVEVPAVRLRLVRTASEVKPLLTLGIAFMVSAFCMLGAAYAVRTMLLQRLGVEAAGLYQAAWTLGGMYIGFVLQAMGTDFYPRLVSVARDNARCNRMVNEQTRVSLLLAGPGVLATLTVAPIVVAIFYSAAFAGAVDVLRWICLGMALRVITWPMGFIVLAKGSQRAFLGTEIAWTIVYLGLATICIARFGIAGAGIAFLIAYVFHAAIIYPIVRHLSGFRWQGENQTAASVFVGSIALVFTAISLLPTPWGMLIGVVVTGASSVYTVRTLVELVPERVPAPVRQWLVRCRLARS